MRQFIAIVSIGFFLFSGCGVSASAQIPTAGRVVFTEFEDTVTTEPENGEMESTESTETVIEDGWHDTSYYVNGVALTGLQKIGDYYFAFDENGILLTGWQRINGKRYYFSDKGKVGKLGASFSGWKTIDGKKYYFSKKGACKTGIQKIKGQWYFFTKNGVLKTKKTTQDGVTYYFSDKGILEAYVKKRCIINQMEKNV